MYRELRCAPSAGARHRATHRNALVAALITVAALRSHSADASLLLAPASGAPDNATNGSVVAKPTTPDSALFTNPAGLVGFTGRTQSFSLGVIFPSTEVDSDLASYNRSDDRAALLPSGAMSVPLANGWRFGFGAYGSVGTVFDFEAEPPTVDSDFVSEVSIGAAPLAIAYEVNERWWIGAELLPLFGYVRNRYTLMDPGSGTALPIKYVIRGPGIQSMVGTTWIPNERWSVGLSVKTPGMIWLDGSTVVAGDRVDVDLYLRMPTVVWGGVTRRLFDRADVSASVRWTDASVFGESKIEYANFAIPFVPDGKDEWRFALGAEYEATERWTLRVGTSYASRIVGNKGVSPLLFDTEDVKLSAGVSYAFGSWSFDVMGGQGFARKRHIPPEDALILPGTYEAGGPIVMLGVTFAQP